MARTVTMIPPSKVQHSNKSNAGAIKRRVAAYARVSTDSEEQLTSYGAQVDYYTNYIQNNESWQFVEVYSDEGITATNTKQRDGFNQMIKDALEGEIDLILTKSVSRFARNTVDSLTTVRKLKEHGVEVYFEKENIYTFDGKGELLITIMSSLAQEESRSISENVVWGCRKRFADGKVTIPYSSFLGYEKGEDGQPKIVEKEAKIVRLIYKMFLEGKTPTYISKYLTNNDISTPTGRKKWSSTTVESILKNEKYKGSALLQKTFTTNFLTKKKKTNEGEIPQYYVEDSHAAIVSKEVYDLVQLEFEKRRNSGNYKTTATCFSGMIICGECGSIYGSKVWHSNSKYRRTIWQCNRKFKNEKKCCTPHLTEEMIKDAFISAFNEMVENKDAIVAAIEHVIATLMDTKEIDKKIHMAQEVYNETAKIISDYVELNSRTVISQSEYTEQFNSYADDCESANKIVKQLQNYRIELLNHEKQITAFLIKIKGSDILQEFNEELFCGVVERVVVFMDRVVFEFKNDDKRKYMLQTN